MPDVRETGKLYCIEDAHTRSNTIWNVHDEDINIMSVAVGRHTDGYQCYGFFKFEPHGVPDNAVIVSATFGGRVYQRLLSGSMDLTARPCSGPWTDTEITYKTMPTSAGVSDSVAMADVGDPVESDITAIVQAWFHGDFAYENGLYITSSAASSYKRVYSHTAPDDDKPYINIVYYVPASKPTTDKAEIEITAGTTVNITTNRHSEEYTHTLTWELGSATGAIAGNVMEAYKWTLSEADVSKLLEALPAAVSGKLKIVCETRDAAGNLLGTENATLAAMIQESIKPVLTEVVFEDVGLVLGTFWAGASHINVTTTAKPGAGSSIRAISVTLGSNTYTGSNVTVPLGTVGGGQVISVTAEDMRGRKSAATTRTVDVRGYTPPALLAFTIDRCSSDGSAEQVDGENLRFTLHADALLVSETEINRLRAEIETKTRSSDEWTLAGTYESATNQLALENVLLPGVYSPLSSYDVRLRLTDTIGGVVERQTVITTATSLIHFDAGHKRVTFGRVGENTDPDNAVVFGLRAKFWREILLSDDRILENVLSALESGIDSARGETAALGESLNSRIDSLGTSASHTVTEFGSQFEPYEDGSNPVLFRAGKTVYMHGKLTPTASISGSITEHVMFALPRAYWPAADVYQVCQGSTAYKWLLHVKVDGTVTFSRYSTSSYASASAGAWLAFSAAWIASDSTAEVRVTYPENAMTSASSADCVASASTEYGSDYYAWRAFNLDWATAYGWASKDTDSAPWLQLQMPRALKNISVKLTNRTRSSGVNGPIAGTVLGSNDGNEWTQIGAFSGFDGTTSGGVSGTVVCKNAIVYRYVRVAFTEWVGGKGMSVGEMSVTGAVDG